MDISIFIKYAELFESHGFKLFLVGGSSRDYLLGKDFNDLDLATDASPIEMKKIIPDFDFTFEKFGNAHKKNVDITTLREEKSYLDYRHPNKVKFVKDISIDYKRRDFTVNAIYIDKNFKVYDFCNGLYDLKHKIIRFIGDPQKRIKEDPLRILRALRFEKKLNFKIEPNTLKAIKENMKLIDLLNKDKIKSELDK